MKSAERSTRVLVTGATGFIGRHVCAALHARGHVVRALVRPGRGDPRPAGAEVVVGDVTVPESLPPALAGVDAVIHLAGVTYASRLATYHQVNTAGTVNLAAAAAGRPLRRFVFVSTLAAQGPSPRSQPHVSPGGEAPINAYGRSKLAAEAALADRDGHELPLTVLRPAIVYGPGDSRLLAWSRLIRRRVVPVVPGLELSFLHVDDLVALLVALVERGDAPAGPLFLSDGAPRAMDQVVDFVERAAAHAPAMRLPLSSGLLSAAAPVFERLAEASGVGRLAARTIAELAASGWACVPDEARRALDFTPSRDLLSGLAETFDWYRAEGWLQR